MGLEEIVKKLSSGGGSASERRVIQKRAQLELRVAIEFPKHREFISHDGSMYVCHDHGLPFTIKKYPSHVVASIYHTTGSVMGIGFHHRHSNP